MAKKRRSTLLIFSIIYLAVAAVGTGVIYFLNQNESDSQLTEIGEEMNIALAQGFARSIWPRYSNYLTTVKGTGEQIRKNEQTQEIHKVAADLATKIPVIKIKIYNLDGLTVYSSNESQLGEDKSGNRGFRKAAQFGTPASKISVRGTFATFDQDLANVAVAETYVPIYGKSRKIEGVFELYSNLTPIVNRANKAQFQLIAVVSAVFALVYIFTLTMLQIFNRRSSAQQASNTRQMIELENAKKKLQESGEKARILEKEVDVLRSVAAQRLTRNKTA